MKRALCLAVVATPCLWSAASALPGLSASAQADVFGDVSLLSQRVISRSSPNQPPTEESQQADYAHDPAISEDGRYVAFDGSLGGVAGVWRRDLQTGAVERVDACPAEQGSCVAELPSISANGQYVSFTTTARLTAGDGNDGPDVYVRNMDKQVSKAQAATSETAGEIDESAAFTPVSAADGSEEGLTYEFPSAQSLEEKSFDEAHYGSIASGRSALSADGSKVVFVTTAVSDLASSKTPMLQVAVRNLQTESTQLVSVAYDPASGGPAIDPSTGAEKPVSGEEGGSTYGAVYSPSLPPRAFVAPAAYALQSLVGASISADGSTVSWMGQDVALQAPVLPAETLSASYAEPLWRRIADGPGPPTRRISGGSDPTSPACVASGETALAEVFSSTDPCQGPFRTEGLGVWTGGVGDPVPQLSADGRTVAFLAGAPPAEGNFGEDALNRHSDLYVANMAAGLSRKQALQPLTELASGNAQEPATTAPIVDLGMSPNGNQVAFTTQRTVFPLGSPAYVSAPAATPGMVELFDVDLADNTLTRVSGGFAGGAGEALHGTEVSGQDPYGNTDGALSPSFSGNGDTLVFSSTAANLVYGDGNTPQQTNSSTFDGSDVFAVDRTVFGTTPPPQEVSSPPPPPALVPAWHLGVTALSQRNGSVLLEIQTPGTGQLRAGAQSAVRTSTTGSAGRSRPSHDRRSAHARIVTRTVATATIRPRGEGLTSMTLELAKRYSALAGAHGGLSATVSVALLAPGHAALHQSIAVTFVRAAHTVRHTGKSHSTAKPTRAHRKTKPR